MSDLNQDLARLQVEYGWDQENVPTPALSLNDLPNWSLLNLVDVLDTIAQGYEAANTGMNGLRLEHFRVSANEIFVQQKEVCPAYKEDLSSVRQWTDKDIDSEVLKTYWVQRSMSGCVVIAMGCVVPTLKYLEKHGQRTLQFEGARLLLSTVQAQTFELSCCTKTVCAYGPNSSTHHPMELQAHTVVTIVDENSGDPFVVDLAGAQFGMFGSISERPHIICEPVAKWVERFFECRPMRAMPLQSMAGQINRAHRICLCVMANRLSKGMAVAEPTAASTTQSQLKDGEKTLRCAGCNQSLSESSYSATQRKNKGKRKCKECAAATATDTTKK